ncbi:MAG: cell surface protein [Phenylobacterium sp.]
MRPLATAAILGLALAVAGCSKPTQEKTTQDLKAVGSEVKDAAKQVADTPAAKHLGSDLKQGTQEAAAKTKEAASDAGDKLKAGAADAGDKLKAGAKDAGAKTDKALNDAKDRDKH